MHPLSSQTALLATHRSIWGPASAAGCTPPPAASMRLSSPLTTAPACGWMGTSLLTTRVAGGWGVLGWVGRACAWVGRLACLPGCGGRPCAQASRLSHPHPPSTRPPPPCLRRARMVRGDGAPVPDGRLARGAARVLEWRRCRRGDAELEPARRATPDPGASLRILNWPHAAAARTATTQVCRYRVPHNSIRPCGKVQRLRNC